MAGSHPACVERRGHWWHLSLAYLQSTVSPGIVAKNFQRKFNFSNSKWAGFWARFSLGTHGFTCPRVACRPLGARRVLLGNRLVFCVHSTNTIAPRVAFLNLVGRRMALRSFVFSWVLENRPPSPSEQNDGVLARRMSAPWNEHFSGGVGVAESLRLC